MAIGFGSVEVRLNKQTSEQNKQNQKQMNKTTGQASVPYVMLLIRTVTTLCVQGSVHVSSEARKRASKQAERSKVKQNTNGETQTEKANKQVSNMA